MRNSYEPSVDAPSIVFQETTVTTHDLGDGIAGEYVAAGQLVGLEIRDAAQRVGGIETLQRVLLERIGPAAP